jgi:hypothetical protein
MWRLIRFAFNCYEKEAISINDTALIETMVAVSDGFEACGCRRMRAAWRRHGLVANHKKMRCLSAARSDVELPFEKLDQMGQLSKKLAVPNYPISNESKKIATND